MIKRRFYILFAVLALTGWLIYHVLHEQVSQGPKIGAYAPNFTLNDSDNRPVSLKDLRGKVVLLNFWATWCGPCQYEMPSIEALYQKYKDRGFVVLGVSLDEEGWPVIHDFIKQVPISFPIVNDGKQEISDIYQTYRIPETYLIDPKGMIEDKFVGPQNYDQEVFFKKLERLLPKASGAAS